MAWINSLWNPYLLRHSKNPKTHQKPWVFGKTLGFWQKPPTHGQNTKNPGFFTTLDSGLWYIPGSAVITVYFSLVLHSCISRPDNIINHVYSLQEEERNLQSSHLVESQMSESQWLLYARGLDMWTVGAACVTVSAVTLFWWLKKGHSVKVSLVDHCVKWDVC